MPLFLQAIEQIVQEVRKRLPAWIDPAALTKEIFDESFAQLHYDKLIQGRACFCAVINFLLI
jgi:c-di-GMP-related signal transduction protein